MLEHENRIKAAGFNFIVGIDEAGRGPLAGPVVAAAVILHKTDFKNKIADSKLMSERQREKAFHEILEHAYVGVGMMNELIIDKHNILRATFLAMHQALERVTRRLPKNETDLSKKIYVLIDGNKSFDELAYKQEAIVDGDKLVLSIACASIIAKVTRDRILKVYDHIFPAYGFKVHKGYGTRGHRDILKKIGPSPIHRKTFKFV